MLSKFHPFIIIKLPMDLFQRLLSLGERLIRLMTELNSKFEEDHQSSREKFCEEYVDTAWVKKTFGLSASTLCDYRKRGIIPFTYFEERGKIFYKKYELLEILEQNHQAALSNSYPITQKLVLKSTNH